MYSTRKPKIWTLITFMWRNGRGSGGESYFCNLGKPETSSCRTEYYRIAGQSSLKSGPSRVNGTEWDPPCTSRVPRKSLSNNISTLSWLVGVRYTLRHFLGNHSTVIMSVYFRCSDITNEPTVWRRHFKLTKLHKQTQELTWQQGRHLQRSHVLTRSSIPQNFFCKSIDSV